MLAEQRRLAARTVIALDGSTEIADGALVRLTESAHPLGRALHDAGPGERLEIGGVDIVTLEPPREGVRYWCVYRVADAVCQPVTTEMSWP